MQSSEKSVTEEISHENLLHDIFISQNVYLLIAKYNDCFYSNIIIFISLIIKIRILTNARDNRKSNIFEKTKRYKQKEEKYPYRNDAVLHPPRFVYYARIKYLLHSYAENLETTAMNSSLVCYEARKLNIEFLRPRFSARASSPAFLCGKYFKFFTAKLKMG